MATSHLYDNRSVTSTAIRRTVLVGACLTAIALVAGCGSQSEKAESSAAPANLISIEEAGAGETQSSNGGLGSREYPFTWEDFAVGDGPLGSLEPFAKGGRNVCGYAEDELKDFTRFGVPGRAAEVWLYESWKFSQVTVVCSAPSAPIWGNTTGPGRDGLSVPCPEWAPYVDQRTRGLTMLDTPRAVGMKSFVTQSSGGYGRNGDGLWNYKFHNWSTTELTPTIWAICRKTPTP